MPDGYRRKMNSLDYIAWAERGVRNGFYMPPAPHWFWRLPGIRHLWVLREKIRVERWYAYGPGSLGAARSGYDDWVLYGMWNDLWPDNETEH